MSEAQAIEIEKLLFKHLRVVDAFDGAQQLLGTSDAADAILAFLGKDIEARLEKLEREVRVLKQYEMKDNRRR